MDTPKELEKRLSLKAVKETEVYEISEPGIWDDSNQNEFIHGVVQKVIKQLDKEMGEKEVGSNECLRQGFRLVEQLVARRAVEISVDRNWEGWYANLGDHAQKFTSELRDYPPKDLVQDTKQWILEFRGRSWNPQKECFLDLVKDEMITVGIDKAASLNAEQKDEMIINVIRKILYLNGKEWRPELLECAQFRMEKNKTWMGERNGIPPGGAQPEDIVQESIRKLLLGTRKWPYFRINLLTCIKGIIRSEISNLATGSENQKIGRPSQSKELPDCGETNSLTYDPISSKNTDQELGLDDYDLPKSKLFKEPIGENNYRCFLSVTSTNFDLSRNNILERLRGSSREIHLFGDSNCYVVCVSNPSDCNHYEEAFKSLTSSAKNIYKIRPIDAAYILLATTDLRWAKPKVAAKALGIATNEITNIKKRIKRILGKYIKIKGIKWQ